MQKKSVSVIIPVYNEAQQIEITVKSVIENLETAGCIYKIILIDDGSRDNSWEKIKVLSDGNNNIHAIKFSRNFGKESAICAGLERSSGDCCIVMDADMQHPPSLLPEMIRLWRDEGFEVIEAKKTSRGKEHWLNKFGAAVFYSLLKRLGGYDLKNASDFKLLDEKVVNAWRRMSEHNTFFRAMSAWVGFKRTTVPFEVSPRDIGKSRWSFFKLTGLAVNAITSYSSLPLHIVTILGVLLLIGSLAMAVITLVQKFTGQALTGFTTVILLQLIIGSCLMISLGIIGTYIARIFDEVKSRPRYIISEETNFRNSEDINN